MHKVEAAVEYRRLAEEYEFLAGDKLFECPLYALEEYSLHDTCPVLDKDSQPLDRSRLEILRKL